MTATATTIGLYMFDEVEVLDFAGPFEVFSTAARVHARRRPQPAARHAADPPLFSVALIASEARTVRARGGLPVPCAHSLRAHPRLDVLVVPGGVVTAELARPELADWIARVAAGTKLTASVCTGAFLLAQAGLLDGRRAATHWEDQDDLRRMFPAVTVEPDARWVDEGAIVTSAGISAGLDMSLHLVARLADPELARLTARQMDYDWRSHPLD